MTRPTDAEMAEWERGLNRSLDGVPMRARLKEMFSALVSERERADKAEQHLAEIELAVDNSESLGAAIELGGMFEDTALVMMRLSLRSQLGAAKKWAAWFAAERGYWHERYVTADAADWNARSLGLMADRADLAESRLAAIQQLFTGGPDTEIRTTWHEGVECWEVTADSMRHALDELMSPS